MNKRILQIVTGVLAIIPVVTGIIGMWGLNDPIYASTGLTANRLLDSNLRFFSGVWLAAFVRKRLTEQKFDFLTLAKFE